MRLGEIVKILREKKGWRQKQLADASGITQATISRLEKGLVNQLKSDALGRLANALGVSADILLGLEPSREESIDKIFDFVIRDPNFRYGAGLRRDPDPETKLFIIELYEKISGRNFL
jgi:transcriptional regulator with XRE-family HTH domain